MKKILSIFGVGLLSIPTSTAVVSCEEQPEVDTRPNINVIKNDLDDVVSNINDNNSLRFPPFNNFDWESKLLTEFKIELQAKGIVLSDYEIEITNYSQLDELYWSVRPQLILETFRYSEYQGVYEFTLDPVTLEDDVETNYTIEYKNQGWYGLYEWTDLYIKDNKKYKADLCYGISNILRTFGIFVGFTNNLPNIEITNIENFNNPGAQTYTLSFTLDNFFGNDTEFVFTIDNNELSN